MPDLNEFNQNVIDEFRANAGRVGPPYEAVSLLLLHTTGAKSGLERVNPLAYRQVGDAVAVFGTKAGAPSPPDWYHNIVANPSVTYEVGSETVAAIARVVVGEERSAIWEAQAADWPRFAEYEAKSGREIPVILLERT